jgi:protein SCO1
LEIDVGSVAQRFRNLLLAAAAASLSLAPVATAQIISKELPKEFQGVDLVSKLGEQVPLDLQFTSGEGKKVELRKYFRPNRPVVLALVYFRCPMTCPLVLEKLQQGINGLSYIVGEDFNTVVVSFDPTETAETAAQNKLLYLGGYSKPVTPVVRNGWDFLVSPDSAASTLAQSVGFHYKLVPESGQYSHPNALIVLTPEGKVARYISGLDYTPQDLRLALLEASEGKIAQSMGDFFLHLCFRFDASTGKYTVRAFRVMQLGGILTAVSLATLITGLRASERLKRHRLAAAAAKQAADRLPTSLIGQAR